MARLRKTWRRIFDQAMTLLRRVNHPIARYTADLIDSKEVVVLSFSQMEHRDYLELRSEYDDVNEVKFPTSMPLARKAVQKFENDWFGMIYKNRIYIGDMKDPQQFAKILIHEINHYINDSNNHYETVDDKFREEFRARLAETLVFGAQTRNYLVNVAKDVSKNYKLPMPTAPIEMPSGLFYR